MAVFIVKATQKSIKIISNFVKENLRKIEVLPGKCRMNCECYRNAVHDAIEAGEQEIALVVYLDCDKPMLHCVNYKNDKFTDNTLGHWSATMEYYFIKLVFKHEYFNITQIARDYALRVNKIIPKHIRLFSNYTFAGI